MSGTGEHTLEGTRNVLADGFGTLVMPNMTYENCLRIKSIVDGTVTTDIFGTVPFTTVTYSWFQILRNGPILTVKTDLNFFNVEAKYYYENPLIGLEELNQNASFKLFPNPVEDVLNIHNDTVLKINSLKVYDVKGQMILMESNDFSRINLYNLQTGTYIVKIETSEKVIVNRILKL